MLGIDVLIASTGINNPMQMSGSVRILNSHPEYEYDAALAYALLENSFPTHRITAITGISFDDIESSFDSLTPRIPTNIESNQKKKPLLICCCFQLQQFRSLLSNFIKQQLPELASNKKLLRLPHENPKRLPPGCLGLIERLTDYWIYLSLLITKIRICEALNGITYSHNFKEICVRLGISTARIKRAILTALPWPYFFQLITHLYGPTLFDCENADAVWNYGYTYTSKDKAKGYFVANKTDDFRSVLILPLVAMSTTEILDKLSNLKSTLTTATRAHPPKLPSISRICSIAQLRGLRLNKSLRKLLLIRKGRYLTRV
jgi:hypothetical protein